MITCGISRRSFMTLAGLLAVWLRAAPLLAQQPVASDPVFVALDTDGKTATGRIRQLAAAGGVTLVTAEHSERVIEPGKLVRLTRETRTSALAPEMPVLLFPDGDRLHRTSIGAATETDLEVQSFSLGNLSVPLDGILGMILSLPADAGPDAIESLGERIRREPRSSEVLWLANGDRVVGGYLAMTDQAIEFLVGKSAVKIDRSGLLAIGFDPSNVRYPQPKGGFLELTLTDGSRLGVSDARMVQGQVEAKARFGAAVRVPIADVLGIRSRHPAIEYLTEREPAAERTVPYVGPPRPSRPDSTVEGHAFRLSGQDYDRGIGTQSRSLLAYRLKPGDRRFQALVGLDDRAGPLGNVVFRVLVDSNQEVFASPPMSARDAPKAIDVDVSGAKILILVTEFAGRGGVRDIADWVEARILTK